MKVLFWRSLVVIFVTLGFIGAVLPGMPTTVFLILATWAASKGWPQMDEWLLNHLNMDRLYATGVPIGPCRVKPNGLPVS